jgi:F-type H+-transporting ATPase subunit gamma
MANIKEIKNRIGSVSFTKQITKAMKMVAAAKLRRTQNLAIPVHFYYDKLKDILNNIYSDIYNGIFNIYVKDRGSENILLVVVSSDKGLCGSFNSILFRKVMDYIKNLSYKKLEILPIGKKRIKIF